jgi:hypothetical protein
LGQEVSKTWDRLRLHILLIEFDYKICTSDSATYGEVMAGRPQLVALEEQLFPKQKFCTNGLSAAVATSWQSLNLNSLSKNWNADSDDVSAVAAAAAGRSYGSSPFSIVGRSSAARSGTAAAGEGGAAAAASDPACIAAAGDNGRDMSRRGLTAEEVDQPPCLMGTTVQCVRR